MRRYSPYYSPSRRGYGGRGRSPPPRGRYGGRKEGSSGSLLVRNIPLDCRPEDLRISFERYGPFVDPFDASEAQYHMNGQIFCGRELTVVIAAETRKRPEEMRSRTRVRGVSGYDGRRPTYYGRSRSRSRSLSRSRSPVYHSGSRAKYRSRSYSPAPRRRSEYSASPERRQVKRSRSPYGRPLDRDDEVNNHRRRSYSPNYDMANRSPVGKGYEESPRGTGRQDWESPRRISRSPPGSRSRSAELSPRPSRR